MSIFIIRAHFEFSYAISDVLDSTSDIFFEPDYIAGYVTRLPTSYQRRSQKDNVDYIVEHWKEVVHFEITISNNEKYAMILDGMSMY